MHKASRLYPSPQKDLDPTQIYADLDFKSKTSEDEKLPYVIMNVASTLDGKVSRYGKSSGIGSNLDRTVMRTIRSKVDAVLVGAGTVRAEKLSLTVTEELSEQRVSQGKNPQPLGVILSRTGEGLNSTKLSEITPNHLLLTERDLRKTHNGHRGRNTCRDSLEHYLRILKSDNNVETLLVEGGPTINHSLFRNLLANELFLTLSPKIQGGEEINLVRGDPIPEEMVEDQKLISLYSHDSEIFLRYLLKRSSA